MEYSFLDNRFFLGAFHPLLAILNTNNFFALLQTFYIQQLF